tara:strand:- start:5750 stop:6388 length:639 start_codon:yes stop_codon:yes gene_type:complete
MESLTVNWRVVSGCFRISEGCNSCPSYWEYLDQGKDYSPKINEEALTLPYESKEPTVFSVAFGSDLFHSDVGIEFIKKVFKVMNECPQHTFQVLTKRIDRAKKLSEHLTFTDNIQFGTVVESEEYAGRITVLQTIDAKIKLVSMTPILGPMENLDLTGIDVVTAVRETWGFKRPAKQSWIDSVEQQCIEQNVAFINDYDVYKDGEVSWQEQP